MGDKLWCEQTQNGVHLDFQVKFDLDGQSRSLHKTIGILTNVFYTSTLSLVILAWTGHELSREQTSDWQIDKQTDRQTHTQTHTDACNDYTRRPKLAPGNKTYFNQSVSIPIIPIDYLLQAK